MHSYTAAEIVLIIGAIGVLLVNAITAWRTSTKVDINQAATTDKLKEIHDSTNGNLSKLNDKIALLETKAIVDTESVHALQDIVKNLTTGSNVNIVSQDKK